MRINTNVSALNTMRTLGKTNESVSKQIGRLSSGFRINSARDDAAGLGIANRLRADTQSMKQAARNAEQANSMLQIAEGGASTVQDILVRMKELATQSASDNVDDSARDKIDLEYQSLLKEIDRIAGTTKFQDTKLLNGTFGNTVAGTFTSAIAGVSDVRIAGAAAGTYTVTLDDASATIDDGNGKSQTLTLSKPASGTKSFSFDSFGITVELDASVNLADGGLDASTGTNIVVAGGSSSFLVGSSREYSNEKDIIQLTGLDLTTATLTVSAGDLQNSANAITALGKIDTALGKVADNLGTIGAAQNRLSYAIQNVNATIENTAAAESTIRDADMAAEMTELSRVQILAQAGTAMLAQANQAPQSVLQLMR